MVYNGSLAIEFCGLILTQELTDAHIKEVSSVVDLIGPETTQGESDLLQSTKG